MRAADFRSFFRQTPDYAYALVEARRELLGRAPFEERDAVFPACGEDAVAGRLHLGRIRMTLHCCVAERQAEIAWSHLGESDAWHSQDCFAIRDAFGTFKFNAKQQFT